jgi:hypothetical protein
MGSHPYDLVAKLDDREAASGLARFLDGHEAAARMIFDCLGWYAHTYANGSLRRLRSLERLCRSLLCKTDMVPQLPTPEPPPPFEPLATQFDGASDNPPKNISYEVRVRTRRERTFSDALQPSEYEDVPRRWTVVHRRTRKAILSFRASTSVGRVAIAADGRTVLVLCGHGRAAVRRYPLPI